MEDSTFDPKKRQTLAVMTGTALAIAMPSLSNATAILPTATSTPDDSTRLSGMELTLTLGKSPTVSIHNNTDQLVIVHHIYPGNVSIDGSQFDLNSLFKGSASAVGRGHTRRFNIQRSTAESAELNFPKGLIGSKPIKFRIIASDGAEVHNSTRHFFFNQRSLLPVIAA
ncbi:MAG: hypothetical protein KTR35_08530 [Gammaproteobacteria bacterium]|nr:hypothetical protein [Gammaproteobacteria bacterium]